MRSSGKLCDKDKGQESGIEIPQEINSQIWSPEINRDRQAAFLRGCIEGPRKRRPSGNRVLAEQSGREFSPAISKAEAKFVRVRSRPRLCSQPLQLGTQPFKTNSLQAESIRRSHRMAPNLRRIRGGITVQAETSSNPSNTSAIISKCLTFMVIFRCVAPCLVVHDGPQKRPSESQVRVVI